MKLDVMNIQCMIMWLIKTKERRNKKVTSSHHSCDNLRWNTTKLLCQRFFVVWVNRDTFDSSACLYKIIFILVTLSLLSTTFWRKMWHFILKLLKIWQAGVVIFLLKLSFKHMYQILVILLVLNFWVLTQIFNNVAVGVYKIIMLFLL